MAKKIAKRGNGEGYIKERPDGRWEARISLGIDFNTKKPIRKSFYGKTRKEVQQKMSEVNAQMVTGTLVSNNKLTLGDWLNTWLNIYAKGSVKIGTWETYESYVRAHIIPSLGTILLRDLSAEHLRRFYINKQATGRVKNGGTLSTTTLRNMHAVFHRALNLAVREKHIAHNVADPDVKPKKSRHEISPLTVEQIQTFIEASHNHRFFVPFLIECHTGLRRGELLGLRWQDINFSRKTLSVNKSLIRTRQFGLILEEPKTKSSRRTIIIADEVLDALKMHKDKQAQEKLLAGGAYVNADLVFCNALGKPIDPRNFTEHFERVLKQANLPRIRFHDMRHSHATLLLLQNVQPKVVQDRLGHSTIAMTMDTYSHILPGMQEEATEKVTQALRRNR